MEEGPEIELKFLFAERDSAKIKALVSGASGTRLGARQRLRTIYFDTPDCHLWKGGVTLRVRAAGETHIQTVKRIPASKETNGKGNRSARAVLGLDQGER